MEMRWVLAVTILLGAGQQAEGGGCPDFENTARMWSIHGGKVELVSRTEGKVMGKVRWVLGELKISLYQWVQCSGFFCGEMRTNYDEELISWMMLFSQVFGGV